MVLTWEAEVFAVAAAEVVVETNWKHKVTRYTSALHTLYFE